MRSELSASSWQSKVSNCAFGQLAWDKVFYLDTGIRSSVHIRGIREFATETREIRELCKFRVNLSNCYEFLRICRKVRGLTDPRRHLVKWLFIKCPVIGIKATQNLFDVAKASALSSPQSQNLSQSFWAGKPTPFCLQLSQHRQAHYYHHLCSQMRSECSGQAGTTRVTTAAQQL